MTRCARLCEYNSVEQHGPVASLKMAATLIAVLDVLLEDNVDQNSAEVRNFFSR